MSLAVHEYQLSKFVNNFEKISKSSPQSYIFTPKDFLLRLITFP